MYEKRIVLFLDMMGFRQSLNNPERLVRAITELKAILRPSDEERRFTAFDFIQFSDSIVISAKPPTLASAVMFVLRLALKINALVSIREIPVRGALVYGDFYYKNEILISPAMADAYELESKFARYPRIIVSNTIKEYFRALPANAGRFSIFDSDYEFMTMVDNDGFRFLNYLYSSGATDPDNEQPEHTDLHERERQLMAHRRFIEKNLAKHENERLREKYIWMGNYHNRFLREDLLFGDQMKRHLFVDPKILVLNR